MQTCTVLPARRTGCARLPWLEPGTVPTDNETANTPDRGNAIPPQGRETLKLGNGDRGGDSSRELHNEIDLMTELKLRTGGGNAPQAHIEKITKI